MPKSAGDKFQSSTDEILAAKYVLAALPRDMRLQLDARIVKDHRFAAAVSRWRETLASEANIMHCASDDEIYEWIYGNSGKLERSATGLHESFKAFAGKLWYSLSLWRLSTVMLLIYCFYDAS